MKDLKIKIGKISFKVLQIPIFFEPFLLPSQINMFVEIIKFISHILSIELHKTLKVFDFDIAS